MKEIIRVYVAFESGLVGVAFYLHQRHKGAKSSPLQEIIIMIRAYNEEMS